MDRRTRVEDEIGAGFEHEPDEALGADEHLAVGRPLEDQGVGVVPALVAGLIAVEKVLPWRRTATYGTALVLLTLGVLVLVAPEALPALTVPGNDPMPAMTPMST